MKVENGTVVMGKKNCDYCKNGTESSRIACPDCNGTGRGKRGGARGCKRCFGNGVAYDHENRVPCGKCKGNYIDCEDENTCDYLPEGVFASLTFRVYYGVQMTLAESLLGYGCVYSCTDYGRAWAAKDDAGLIEKVRKQTYIQACKLVNDNDLQMPDHIGIFVSPQGYSVKPVHIVPVPVS